MTAVCGCANQSWESRRGRAAEVAADGGKGKGKGKHNMSPMCSVCYSSAASLMTHITNAKWQPVTCDSCG